MEERKALYVSWGGVTFRGVLLCLAGTVVYS